MGDAPSAAFKTRRTSQGGNKRPPRNVLHCGCGSVGRAAPPGLKLSVLPQWPETPWRCVQVLNKMKLQDSVRKPHLNHRHCVSVSSWSDYALKKRFHHQLPHATQWYLLRWRRFPRQQNHVCAREHARFGLALNKSTLPYHSYLGPSLHSNWLR